MSLWVAFGISSGFWDLVRVFLRFFCLLIVDLSFFLCGAVG